MKIQKYYTDIQKRKIDGVIVGSSLYLDIQDKNKK